MRLSKFYFSSGILALLLSPALTSAQTSTIDTSSMYEAAVVVPWNTVAQSIVSQSGGGFAQHIDLGAVSFVEQGVPITVPSVSLDAQIQLASPQVNQNETIWNSQHIGLTLNVSAFQISKTIVQVISGVQVSVQVQAQCDSFTVVQSQASLQSSWAWVATGNQLGAQLNAMTIAWPANSWQPSALNCTGPVGFADVVQAQLQSELSEPTAFAPAVRSALQSKVTNVITSQFSQWQNPQTVYGSGAQVIKADMAGSKSVIAAGLLLRGTVYVGDSPAGPIIPLTLSAQALSQISATQPTLLVAKSGLQAALQQVSVWPVVKLNLNQVSAFQSLLGSWLVKLFVWPDLLNYSTSSAFWMQSKLAQTAQIVINGPTSGSGTLAVDTWVISNRKGLYWNYVHVLSGVSANIAISISSGNLNLKFSRQKMHSTAAFGPDYISTFNPNTYVGVGTIESAIQTTSYYTQASFALPQFQLTSGSTYQPAEVTAPDAATIGIVLNRTPNN